MTEDETLELRTLLQKRSLPLSETDRMINGKRISAGKTLMRFFSENIDAEHLGEKLVERYMQIPGRGDEYDTPSTVVDAMADMLHFARSRGIAAANVMSAIEFRDGELLCDAIASAMGEFRPVLAETDCSFADATRRALEHVGVEEMPIPSR